MASEILAMHHNIQQCDITENVKSDVYIRYDHQNTHLSYGTMKFLDRNTACLYEQHLYKKLDFYEWLKKEYNNEYIKFIAIDLGLL